VSSRGRGGGRGRGRGGSRGRSGGKGGQRWWDPEWREAKLAEKRAHLPPEIRLEKGEAAWRIQEFIKCDDTEVVWNDLGRDDCDVIIMLANQEEGVYGKKYGKGRSTVLCLSKVPLPDYRCDLDSKFGSQTVEVRLGTHELQMAQKVVSMFPPRMLHGNRRLKPHDGTRDWTPLPRGPAKRTRNDPSSTSRNVCSKLKNVPEQFLAFRRKLPAYG
jgi:hypothetical protein